MDGYLMQVINKTSRIQGGKDLYSARYRVGTWECNLFLSFDGK